MNDFLLPTVANLDRKQAEVERDEDRRKFNLERQGYLNRISDLEKKLSDSQHVVHSLEMAVRTPGMRAGQGVRRSGGRTRLPVCTARQLSVR